MTAQEMAQIAGVSLNTVYKYARLGVIKSTKTDGVPIDFDKSGVKILLEMKTKPKRTKKEPEPVEEKPRKATLREKIVELIKYNEKHNTCYSYGYATAMNII